MKALDLFCGLGGWSDGLAMEGFDVLGVDIEAKIAELYKHPVICTDVRMLDGSRFTGFDLIVGSPPCREFTTMAKAFGHRWKKPPCLDSGLELVNSFLGFVDAAQPRFWLMENHPNLAKYIGEYKVQARLSKGMRRGFWGDFPNFLIPCDYGKPSIWKHNWNHDLRSWQRAIIPLPVARALGRAVKNALETS